MRRPRLPAQASGSKACMPGIRGGHFSIPSFRATTWVRRGDVGSYVCGTAPAKLKNESSGCFDSPAKTFPSLFYCDSRCGSDPEIYYAPFQAQRLMVLSSLDVIYILDFTSYPRWDSSWFVDMPIWKNFSFAILALCNNHIIFTSHLFIRYVFNRNQTNDVFKTWSSY
ncbi:transmembrane protein 267 isoform X2 [Pan paniscus]|uniref:transmembrane protein 267 isoform X2 n=1 Tax=Pan paniscus TaxID=9597 RepID=UPI003005E56D